jgi:hypothetical protein
VKALDCHTFESALESSAAILHLTPHVLARRLNVFNYEALPETERRSHPYEELLIRHKFKLASSEDLPAPPIVHWFHATRVVPKTLFDDGIKPFAAMLDAIWHFLGGLAAVWSTAEQWNAFRAEMPGQGGCQYHSKVGFDFAKGPFGFLVREIVLEPALVGNHDYLGIPEIVEDICLSYDETFGHHLRQRFLEATKPCIVKFRSVEARPDALAAALVYVHRKLLGDELCIDCNTCFDGEGKAVDGHNVLSVEWIDY